MYAPKGVPFPVKGKKDLAPVGEQFYFSASKGAQRRRVILLPSSAVLLDHEHMVKKAPGKGGLPEGLQYDYPRHICTHTPADQVDLSAHPAPRFTQEGDTFSIGEGEFRSSYIQVDNVFCVTAPNCHPEIYHEWLSDGVTVDTEAEARDLCAALYYSARSCTLCAQAQHERNTGVKRGEDTVWTSRPVARIAMFSVERLEAFPNKKDSKKPGRFSWPEAPLTAEDLDHPDVFSTREGFGWIDTPVIRSSRSTAHQAWDNYNQYLSDLGQTCSNCLEKNESGEGSRGSSGKHRISVIGFYYPTAVPDPESLDLYKEVVKHGSTDEIRALANDLGLAYSEVDLRSRDYFREPVIIDGEEDSSTMGIYQISMTPVICPVTEQEVQLVPIRICSSCDHPTPVRSDQVVTEVGIPADKSPVEFALYVDPDDGTFFYPSWEGLEVTNFESPWESVEQLLSHARERLKGGTLWTEFMPPKYAYGYVRLTPEQQEALLHSSVTGFQSKVSSPRSAPRTQSSSRPESSSSSRTRKPRQSRL